MRGIWKGLGLGAVLAVILALAALPAVAAPYAVSGNVTDANVGWGLRASIHITGGTTDTTIWSGTGSGHYTVSLEEGIAYTFAVTPEVPGYNPATVTVGPFAGPVTQTP
jgi:hypothetical protein